MARNYSSVSEPKTLTANITDAAATQITLNNVTGLPSAPYVLVLNPDTAKEEVVLVTLDQTGVTSPTLKVTRALETSGGAGVARNDHTIGDVVKHMIVGSDLQIVHDHVDNTTTAHSLNLKAPLASPTFTGNVVLPSTTSIGNVSATEIGYVDGVTSAIQTQIDAKISKLYTIPTAKTGAYTLAAGDDVNLIELNGTFTVTIPLDSTYSFPIGSTIDIVNVGTGVITTAGAAGVTLNGTPGLKLRAQWSAASFIKRAANTWVIVGDLSV
jgi:hypothetical protein